MSKQSFVQILLLVSVCGDVTSGAVKPVSSVRNSVADFVAESQQNRIPASASEEVVGKLGEIAEVIREGTHAVSRTLLEKSCFPE
jgi:hypothetical protein